MRCETYNNEFATKKIIAILFGLLEKFFMPFMQPVKRAENQNFDHGILVKNEAVMDRIAHRAGLEASRESEEIDEEIQELKKQLRGEYYKEKRAALTEAIRSAEKRGDETALEEALRELIKIPLDTPRT